MIEPLNYAEVGKRIKRIRKQAGITQEQLAERCGLTSGYVSKIETGASKGRLAIYYQLAEVLNVSVDCFLTDTPNSKHSPDDYYIERLINLTDEQKELLDGVINVIHDFKINRIKR